MKLARKLAPLDIILIVLACILIITGVYLSTRGSSQDFSIKKINDTTKNSLTDAKSNGTIKSVSGDRIEVVLPGDTVRLVTIDDNTQISSKTSLTKLSQVKPDTKVVLFTKQVGDTAVATSLFIQ